MLGDEMIFLCAKKLYSPLIGLNYVFRKFSGNIMASNTSSIITGKYALCKTLRSYSSCQKSMLTNAKKVMPLFADSAVTPPV